MSPPISPRLVLCALARHFTDCISHGSDTAAAEGIDDFTGVDDHLTDSHPAYFTGTEEYTEPPDYFIVQALESTFYTLALIFPGTVIKNKGVIASFTRVVRLLAAL